MKDKQSDGMNNAELEDKEELLRLLEQIILYKAEVAGLQAQEAVLAKVAEVQEVEKQKAILISEIKIALAEMNFNVADIDGETNRAKIIVDAVNGKKKIKIPLSILTETIIDRRKQTQLKMDRRRYNEE